MWCHPLTRHAPYMRIWDSTAELHHRRQHDVSFWDGRRGEGRHTGFIETAEGHNSDNNFIYKIGFCLALTPRSHLKRIKKFGTFEVIEKYDRNVFYTKDDGKYICKCKLRCALMNYFWEWSASIGWQIQELIKQNCHWFVIDHIKINAGWAYVLTSGEHQMSK